MTLMGHVADKFKDQFPDIDKKIDKHFRLNLI